MVLFKRGFVEKFSNVAKETFCQHGKTSHAKMVQSPLVTFGSLSVNDGVDRGHRRQLVVFESFINTCVPIKKSLPTERDFLEPVVVFSKLSL